MVGLKKLLKKVSGNSKFSFKPEKHGVCEFCGEEAEVSNKTVLEKVKGVSHPGISKSQETFPYICESCSFVFSTISTTRPSKVFSERKLLVVEEDKYYFLKDLDQIKQMVEGRYFFLFPLSTSNYMPINFYDLRPTINPKKNININYILGSVFETLEIETDKFFQLIESKNKSIHLINAIRKAYRIKEAINE